MIKRRSLPSHLHTKTLRCVYAEAIFTQTIFKSKNQSYIHIYIYILNRNLFIKRNCIIRNNFLKQQRIVLKNIQYHE